MFFQSFWTDFSGLPNAMLLTSFNPSLVKLCHRDSQVIFIICNEWGLQKDGNGIKASLHGRWKGGQRRKISPFHHVTSATSRAGHCGDTQMTKPRQAGQSSLAWNHQNLDWAAHHRSTVTLMVYQFYHVWGITGGFKDCSQQNKLWLIRVPGAGCF